MKIRRLCREDREVLFGPRLRHAADAWLEHQARDEVHVAVAEVENVPVGRAGLDFVRSRDGDVAVLWAAHVEPEWQSHGIGTAA